MKEKKEIRRRAPGGGRKKKVGGSFTLPLTAHFTQQEVIEMKVLMRDTKAKSMSALIRNLMTFGLLNLADGGALNKNNALYYKRFLTYFDTTSHLSEYNDEIGKMLRGENKKKLS